MLTNKQKEIFQSKDIYYVEISNQKEYDAFKSIFNQNRINNKYWDMHTQFLSNQDNFYLTNQSTWTANPNNEKPIYTLSQWIDIAKDKQTLTKFEIGKLYKIRSYEDLKYEFPTNSKDTLIVGNNNFTIAMSTSIALKSFFQIKEPTDIFSIGSWNIVPEMCYEVTTKDFFQRFYNTAINDQNRLLFEVNSLDEDLRVRKLLSKFNKHLTQSLTIDINNKGSFYTLTQSYGSKKLAIKNKYQLISVDIFEKYTNAFKRELETTTYPYLDISTSYVSDISRTSILTKAFNTHKDQYVKNKKSFLILLPNNSIFITNITTKGERYDSHKGMAKEVDKQFINLKNSQLEQTSKYMIDNLFNTDNIICDPTIPAVQEPVIEQLLIEGISFANTILETLARPVDISIQTKDQLDYVLKIFKDYGKPYYIIPKFKRGMLISVSDSKDNMSLDKKVITTAVFRKLEEHNSTVLVTQPSYIKKSMKQFYLKKIESKFYHNDVEVCKEHLSTQGKIHLELITGSKNRYFSAKELGIPHDGLEEKSKRIMDLIINELDSPESIADSEWVMLLGEAGSGKTYIAEQYFNNKKQDYVKQQGFAQLSGDDLLGYISITNQEYRPSLLREAVEQGKGYILDETHACNPNTLMIFNALKGTTMQFPDKKIDIHPDFRLIFTANTIEFSEKYNAGSKLDHAFITRCSIIEYNLDKLDMAERYKAKYLKQIPDFMSFDPRVIQRKVRHLIQKEQKDKHENEN